MKLRTIQRITKDFCLFSLATYGALWLLTEPLLFFLDISDPPGLGWYIAFLLASVSHGAWRARRRDKVLFRIPTSDSSLEITFGDIFEGEAVVVIPVNEYFDGELGDHVSEYSLHGQFIRNVLGGQSNSFHELTEEALKSAGHQGECVERQTGQCTRYPIGTVAKVDVNEKRFLLVALSVTDVDTLKASASVRQLWECLTGMWRGVRDYSNGRPVNLPLIGSGLSGIGLPKEYLVDIIAMSYIDETKKRKVSDKVNLVLPKSLKGELDLVAIQRKLT